MHILGDQWRDGYLDYYRSAGELRIQVSCWWTLERLNDVFIPQPRSMRRVWNYVHEYGVKEVIRKIRSRLSERLRDRRVIAIGVGQVCEADPAQQPGVGNPVVFIAPAHPECVERVVVPAHFVRAVPQQLSSRLAAQQSGIRRVEQPPRTRFDWSAVAGWSRYSEAPPPVECPAMLEWAVAELEALDGAAGDTLALTKPTPIRERTAVPPQRRDGRTAVLYGLGNYAKTVILPNIDPRIEVTCIHEIEPTQIGVPAASSIFDTSDVPRSDEHFDIYLIAGYHHTHTDLAVHAMENGGFAVVEKPQVTTRKQLERLTAAMRKHPGRLFMSFYMRFGPLWPIAREDLKAQPGEPINYHCIVFEIPLPGRHWYNWPASRSRVVYNGCHWLDHFLFMNQFCEPVRYDLFRGRNGDVHASVELENGATFSMALTDHGSPRLGVQDHIELRANGVTVSVENASRYVAEDRHRILRRTRADRFEGFRAMYRTISRKIMDNEPGDSVDSTLQSCRLMLDLQEIYEERGADSRFLAAPNETRSVKDHCP